MTTKKTKLEGGVSRAVDFNLKKEDVMLLILEGRKEVMEETISGLQTKSTELKKEIDVLQKKFENAVRNMVVKSMNKASMGLAQENMEDGTKDPKKNFLITFSNWGEYVNYTKYRSQPIGDNRTGSAYIKSQSEASVILNLYTRAEVKVSFSFGGVVFANKADVYYGDKVNACTNYPIEVTLVNQNLDKEFQKTMPEYKALKEACEEYGKNETLLSDILAEYDLFNRNQPRAKAKMIKEVLARDESGRDLLENVMAAAKGTKLLALEAKKD